jgi:hypothetical protein
MRITPFVMAIAIAGLASAAMSAAAAPPGTRDLSFGTGGTVALNLPSRIDGPEIQTDAEGDISTRTVRVALNRAALRRLAGAAHRRLTVRAEAKNAASKATQRRVLLSATRAALRG